MDPVSSSPSISPASAVSDQEGQQLASIATLRTEECAIEVNENMRLRNEVEGLEQRIRDVEGERAQMQQERDAALRENERSQYLLTSEREKCQLEREKCQQEKEKFEFSKEQCQNMKRRCEFLEEMWKNSSPQLGVTRRAPVPTTKEDDEPANKNRRIDDTGEKASTSSQTQHIE